MQTAKQTLTFPFRLLRAIGLFLFHRKLLKREVGAKFASKGDYLARGNDGLLLDGQDLRLSERESFQNVCVVAAVGAGKTTNYIVPNVLERAKKQCSIVVNDPKGEVFELTSGYMMKNGYRIIVIDPEDLSRSNHFNPLAEARNDIELEQIAEILVRCGNTDKKDDFWNQGAMRFVALFLKCLKIAGEENQAYFNLHNLYYLLQNFGEDGSKLDTWMTRNTANPDNPGDTRLWNEWNGVLTGNADGVRSFVMNALTALKALNNPNVAKLTAYSDFNLENLRRERTIVYVITPAQHAEYYSFLTSVFFRSVFNACMRRRPVKQDLSIYVLYDEFGHSTIPNFVSTANTIRGYRVSLSIVLQSIAQLSARYGKDMAQSIQGGFNTYLTYSGSDAATVQFFSTIIGKTKVTQRKDPMDPYEYHYEEYLLNPNEIRTMDEKQVLVVANNKNPLVLETKGYYQNPRLNRHTKIAPSEQHRSGDTPLAYLEL